MKTLLACIGAMLCCMTLTAYPQAQPTTSARKAGQVRYDAKWWADADHDRHKGFFWGASDCLTFTAHVGRGFFGTSGWFNSDAFDKEVTDYYLRNPGAGTIPVIEVWRKVGRQIASQTPYTPGGEVDSSPFGDGLWYRGASFSERLGYLEGYIGCVRNYVRQPSESYSHPIEYYDDHVWDYVAARPEADQEAIADILRRFRDKAKAN
jgi:hypothetical protein